jgi:hypothetical protein
LELDQRHGFGDELKPIGPSTNGDLTINQWGFNHQPMGI